MNALPVAAVPVPRWLLAVLLGCVAFGWWQSRTPPIATAIGSNGAPLECRIPRLGHAAGLALPDSPRQFMLAPGLAPFAIGEHRILPRAEFAIDATVLGSKRYRYGLESAVSPLDLALGWGQMARPDVSAALDISQSGRWYHYRWGPEGPPIAVEAIIAQSSNMHMIPSSPRVAEKLLAIDEGERVRLVGWLVDVELPGRGHWRTSLRRDDSGNGACEIVYVCDVATTP